MIKVAYAARAACEAGIASQAALTSWNTLCTCLDHSQICLLWVDLLRGLLMNKSPVT
jgi:hypothetical protein